MILRKLEKLVSKLQASKGMKYFIYLLACFVGFLYAAFIYNVIKHGVPY